MPTLVYLRFWLRLTGFKWAGISKRKGWCREFAPHESGFGNMSVLMWSQSSGCLIMMPSLHQSNPRSWMMLKDGFLVHTLTLTYAYAVFWCVVFLKVHYVVFGGEIWIGRESQNVHWQIYLCINKLNKQALCFDVWTNKLTQCHTVWLCFYVADPATLQLFYSSENSLFIHWWKNEIVL